MQKNIFWWSDLDCWGSTTFPLKSLPKLQPILVRISREKWSTPNIRGPITKKYFFAWSQKIFKILSGTITHVLGGQNDRRMPHTSCVQPESQHPPLSRFLQQPPSYMNMVVWEPSAAREIYKIIEYIYLECVYIGFDARNRKY